MMKSSVGPSIGGSPRVLYQRIGTLIRYLAFVKPHFVAAFRLVRRPRSVVGRLDPPLVVHQDQEVGAAIAGDDMEPVEAHGCAAPVPPMLLGRPRTGPSGDRRPGGHPPPPEPAHPQPGRGAAVRAEGAAPGHGDHRALVVQ